MRELTSLTNRFLYVFLIISTGPVDKWIAAREERRQGKKDTCLCFRASGKENIYPSLV